MLELRLKEITKNVEETLTSVIKDYKRNKNFNAIKKEIEKLNYDSLLEFNGILKIFEFKSIEEPQKARGYRILSRIPSLKEEQVRE